MLSCCCFRSCPSSLHVCCGFFILACPSLPTHLLTCSELFLSDFAVFSWISCVYGYACGWFLSLLDTFVCLMSGNHLVSLDSPQCFTLPGFVCSLAFLMTNYTWNLTKLLFSLFLTCLQSGSPGIKLRPSLLPGYFFLCYVPCAVWMLSAILLHGNSHVLPGHCRPSCWLSAQLPARCQPFCQLYLLVCLCHVSTVHTFIECWELLSFNFLSSVGHALESSIPEYNLQYRTRTFCIWIKYKLRCFSWSRLQSLYLSYT